MIDFINGVIQNIQWTPDAKLKELRKQLMVDEVFINVAKNMSSLSHCVSRQVGCVITRSNRILVTGINGTAPEHQNCDEIFCKHNFDRAEHRKWADVNEVHAEMNAINFAANFGISIKDSVLYSTLQPCNECSKNIPPAGIKRIVFREMYDRVDNFFEQKQNMLKKGVLIEQIPSPEEVKRILALIEEELKHRAEHSVKFSVKHQNPASDTSFLHAVPKWGYSSEGYWRNS